MKLKYFVFLLVVIIFIGCDNNDNTSSQWDNYLMQYVYPNSLKEKHYDYYEIVDDNITYTHLNMDLGNVVQYFNMDNPSYSNTLYDINTTYPIINKALDINRTEDCMIVNSYDTLTKVRQKDIYIKDYGIYEVSKNYCVNTNNDNCTSYLYIRY